MTLKLSCFLSVILLLTAIKSFTQNVFPSSGRAGINVTNPAASLHVVGGSRIGTPTNFVFIDSVTGNLSLAGTANYRVGANKYVFQFSGNPNYGMYFNQTNARYEFRNSSAAPVFLIGADNGNGFFSGRLGIGNINPAATLDIAGNIKIADGSQGAGKVLTSDGDGLANWQVLPTGVSGNGSAGNLAFWTSTNAIGNSNNLFWDNNNSRLGINTMTPTHSLTLASTGNGLSIYNTSDQTTNYERSKFAYNSNVLEIGTEFEGTGKGRAMRIGTATGAGQTLSSGRVITINPMVLPTITISSGTTSLAGNAIQASGSFIGSSTAQVGFAVAPSISQSSSAGFTSLLIKPTITAVGSSGGININSHSTFEQLRLSYDANNYSSFTVNSAGSLTLTSTNSTIISNGSFQTAGTAGSANLWVTSNASYARTTLSQYLFGSASGISLRMGMRGTNSTTITAGDSYGSFVVGQQVANIPSSGTSFLFAQQVIKPLSITAGVGTLTNSATLYLEDAATGATNNYNLWAAGTGANRLDGKTSIGTSATPSAILHIGASSGAANTAPIKLNPGTLISSPEDGAIERDSSHLYYTIGTTRYQLDQQSNLSGSGTSGQIAYWNGTSSIRGSSNLFWDNNNGRLGIGNITPTAVLDITGNIKIADGTQGSGKVLTSDANGTASWQELPAGITGNGTNGNIPFWTGSSNLGNSNFFFWDNNTNRLGIGTNAPSARLDLIGKIRIQDGTQGVGKILVSDANGIASWTTGVSGSGNSGNIAFWSGTNSLGANTSLFWDNTNKRLGIGNANPIAQLDITGNVKIADGTQGAGKVLTSDASGLANWQTLPSGISGTGTNGNLTIWTGASAIGYSNNLFWDNNNSRLGIGNDNPEAALDISGKIKINDGTQGAGKVLSSDANGIASWQTISAASWAVTGNNIYNSNSGNVGIGTDNPFAKLHLKGNAILTDTSDNSSGNVVIGSSINNLANTKLYVKSTQTYGVMIEAPGSLYGLYVNGSAVKPGGGPWIAASDERLKSNIKPYTEGLTQVMKINPVKFHYNAESGYDTKPEYIGVVAQQIEKVAPYMVGKFKRNTDKKEFLDVDNSAMTYMLINAVKELKQETDTKEVIIKQQQQQIDQLQNQMATVLQKLNEIQAVQQQCCSVALTEVINPGNNQGLVLSEKAGLEQNIPNPYKNKTVIKYHLPPNTENAQLTVTDNTGKTINTIKLTGKTGGQITLDAGLLSPGTYYYSLYINGNKIDTKKMEILR